MQFRSIALISLFLLTSPAFAQLGLFEPVHPDRLIETMPEYVPGFTAGPAKKTMAGEVEARFTFVSRVYTESEGDSWFGADDEEIKPTVTIKITDSAPTSMFRELHSKLAEMGSNNTSGFSRPISVDGYLAVINYREKDQYGLLTINVGERFMVQIGVSGLEEQTMFDFWNKMDQAKLAKLAIPPTPTPVPTPTNTQVKPS